MFVHWGLYALPGWHEQTQWRQNVARSDYAKWFQTQCLRIRGLPVNELLDEVLVVKLEFEGGRV